MALRLVTDADFNGRVTRGVLHQYPQIEIVRAQDVGLRTASDPRLLEWAAINERIVLSHDRTTMTRYAIDRLNSQASMPGLFVMRNEPTKIGRMIETVLIYALCSDMPEWSSRIEFI